LRDHGEASVYIKTGGSMTIYAIGDLHLPGGDKKPMDIFGSHWENHFDKIAQDWQKRVGPEDLVLLPGDISWAMHLEDALSDLRAIAALPGRKVLLRGNHDYWWGTITRLREALPKGMYALQNDAVVIGDYVVCGTRGWILPGENGLEPDDMRIYQRELMRFEMSLMDARRKGPNLPILAMLHYPPFNERQEPSGFTQILKRYGVTDIIYGHLHGPGLKGGFTGLWHDIRCYLVSCDGLQFTLMNITQMQEKMRAETSEEN
jgi:predicted phosphohydrolase